MITRRRFITLAGLGAVAVATPEPVRRYWQVPANAPVKGPPGYLLRGTYEVGYLGYWQPVVGSEQNDGLIASVEMEPRTIWGCNWTGPRHDHPTLESALRCNHITAEKRRAALDALAFASLPRTS